METTQEVTASTIIVDAVPEATTQNDYELMRMINNLKVATRDEVRTEIDVLQAKVEGLTELNEQLSQRLGPLLKFEPLLNRVHNEPFMVRLFDLSDNDREKLLALARLYYPNMSAVFDSGDNSRKNRDPLNQLLSDLLAFLLIGTVEQCQLSMLFRGNKQRGLIINDKL